MRKISASVHDKFEQLRLDISLQIGHFIPGIVKLRNQPVQVGLEYDLPEFIDGNLP